MSDQGADASVALYLPALAGGGAERIFLMIARGLRQRGWSVDLVVASASGPLLSEVPQDVRVVDLGAAHVTTSVIPFARYLRRRRPDAVLAALTHANLAAISAVALSRVQTRLVVTEHQHLSTSLAGPRPRRERLFPHLIRRLYPRAAEIVAVSEGVADDLAHRTGITRSLIRVENNPLQIDELRALAAEEADHPWFAEGEPPVILGVGRLTRQKDFGNLLRAFSLLRKTRRARLVLLGDGEDRAMLEALLSELGLEDDVQIMGFVLNPYPYFRGASLFVLSSRWEGLPTVLLEAMVFGLPVVSTDCHSGPAEILEGGRWGALVPTEDAPSLAAAMEHALPNGAGRDRREYPNLRAYSFDHVMDRYSRLLAPRS